MGHILKSVYFMKENAELKNLSGRENEYNVKDGSTKKKFLLVSKYSEEI